MRPWCCGLPQGVATGSWGRKGRDPEIALRNVAGARAAQAPASLLTQHLEKRTGRASRESVRSNCHWQTFTPRGLAPTHPVVSRSTDAKNNTNLRERLRRELSTHAAVPHVPVTNSTRAVSSLPAWTRPMLNCESTHTCRYSRLCLLSTGCAFPPMSTCAPRRDRAQPSSLPRRCPSSPPPTRLPDPASAGRT